MGREIINAGDEQTNFQPLPALDCDTLYSQKYSIIHSLCGHSSKNTSIMSVLCVDRIFQLIAVVAHGVSYVAWAKMRGTHIFFKHAIIVTSKDYIKIITNLKILVFTLEGAKLRDIE